MISLWLATTDRKIIQKYDQKINQIILVKLSLALHLKVRQIYLVSTATYINIRYLMVAECFHNVHNFRRFT